MFSVHPIFEQLSKTLKIGRGLIFFSTPDPSRKFSSQPVTLGSLFAYLYSCEGNTFFPVLIFVDKVKLQSMCSTSPPAFPLKVLRTWFRVCQRQLGNIMRTWRLMARVLSFMCFRPIMESCSAGAGKLEKSAQSHMDIQ